MQSMKRSGTERTDGAKVVLCSSEVDARTSIWIKRDFTPPGSLRFALENYSPTAYFAELISAFQLRSSIAIRGL